MNDITVGEALGLSLLGLCIVFIVLTILVGFIVLMSAIFKKVAKSKKADKPAAVAEPAAPALARGSCGDIKLNNVPDKTAAMIMAITADKMGKPLNELRFISIKEVED